MTRLVRAELLKARSTKATWALAGAAVAFCALWTVVSVLTLDAPNQVSLPLDLRIQNVYQMAHLAHPFTLILGIVAMAGEYRHHTVTSTFLVTPRRQQVIAAKLVALTLIGLLVAVAAEVVTTGIAMPLLTATGNPVIVPGIPAILIGSALSTTLYTTIGVGVGALVRSQTAGIAIAVIWFYYAEYLLVWQLPDVGRWLPGGAAKAISGWNVGSGDLLPAWAGGVLLIVYALAVATAANLITVRRDIG